MHPRTNPPRRAAASALARKEFVRPDVAQLHTLRTHTLIRKSEPLGVVAKMIERGIVHFMTRDTLVDFFAPEVHIGTSENTVMHYLSMICNHVNIETNRAQVGNVPFCLVWSSNLWTDMTHINGRRKSPSVNHRSIRRYFEGKELTPQAFMAIRHIFVHCCTDTHSMLLVISPLAKAVEVFDSSNDCSVKRITCELLACAFAILDSYLGRAFVPYHWKVRESRGPYQGPTKDCALYTMTTAMHIAFGYPIDYTGSNMRNKRLRIASEILNGGFSSLRDFSSPRAAAADPFYYPLPSTTISDAEFTREYPSLDQGFHAPNESILQELNPRIRNRRGRYDEVSSVDDMMTLCLERASELEDVATICELYDRTLDEWKEACEERDEEIRTKRWRRADEDDGEE